MVKYKKPLIKPGTKPGGKGKQSAPHHPSIGAVVDQIDRKTGLQKKNARTPPGLPRKLTRLAWTRMDELGFDPLEMAVRIAKGEELTIDHPFIQKLQQILNVWRENIHKKAHVNLSDLNALEKLAIEQLSDSYVPLEIRSRHVLDLIQYIYPKRKAIDMDIGINAGAIITKPLSAKEAELFSRKFLENY